MNEMIERVAQAIVESYREHRGLVVPWDEQPAFAKELARANARAAIEAMREPTKAMVEVGNEDGFAGAGERWRTMIDEALRENAA